MSLADLAVGAAVFLELRPGNLAGPSGECASYIIGGRVVDPQAAQSVFVNLGLTPDSGRFAYLVGSPNGFDGAGDGHTLGRDVPPTMYVTAASALSTDAVLLLTLTSEAPCA